MPSIQKGTTIYERFAGLCAVLVGIGSFLYAITFIILVIGERAPELGMLLSSLFLTLIGLFSTIVLVAIYDRLRETDATFALLALLLLIPAQRTKGTNLSDVVVSASWKRPCRAKLPIGGRGAAR